MVPCTCMDDPIDASKSLNLSDIYQPITLTSCQKTIVSFIYIFLLDLSGFQQTLVLF
jgi:hypothetical protein